MRWCFYLKNNISNYIPHEIIICDDRVKELINEKNDISQCYLHSNKDEVISYSIQLNIFKMN